jgi:hypothetical protein
LFHSHEEKPFTTATNFVSLARGKTIYHYE